MNKQEEEYYWAAERKEALVLWPRWFRTAVCVAMALGPSGAAGEPGLYGHCSVLVTVHLYSLYMLKDGNLCSGLSNILGCV